MRLRRVYSVIMLAYSLSGCVTASNNQAGPQAEIDRNSAEATTSNSLPSEKKIKELQSVGPSGPVFQIRGTVARQVSEQLSRQHGGRREKNQDSVTLSGSLDISCLRSGGILPAGATGFPAPVEYNCSIKTSSTDTPSKEVVLLKNGAAKRFFGALAITPEMRQEQVSKSVSGDIVIVCKGANAKGDNAHCEAEKIAH